MGGSGFLSGRGCAATAARMKGPHRWRPVLLATLALLPLAHAAPSAVYHAPSAALLTVHVPVELAAGPQGSVTVGPNKTSASTQVNSGILSALSAHVLVLTNTGHQPVQLRLRLESATNLAQCVLCQLEFRQHLATTVQVSVVLGSVTQSTGGWITLGAAGSGSDQVSLFALGQGSVVLDQVATLRFTLENVPSSTATTRADYYNMVSRFVV
jgi:hypothetical protein